MFRLKEFIAESNVDISKVDTFKNVVISVGRFQPPHRGHRLMIDNLIKLGEQMNADPVIIVVDSGKYDARNPLSGSIRQQYLQKMYSNVEIITAKNPYLAVTEMAERGQLPVGGITGADRADSYKKMIGRIFGPVIEEQFNAQTLHRDPDSNDDIAGVSATKVREAVINEDEGAFRALTGFEHEDAMELMELVRQGMNSDNRE